MLALQAIDCLFIACQNSGDELLIGPLEAKLVRLPLMMVEIDPTKRAEFQRVILEVEVDPAKRVDYS